MYRTRSIVPNRLLTIGKRQPLTRAKKTRRPAGGKHAAMDFRRFQMGVDLRLDAHQLPGALEIVDAIAKIPITHGKCRPQAPCR